MGATLRHMGTEVILHRNRKADKAINQHIPKTKDMNHKNKNTDANEKKTSQLTGSR